MNDSGTIALYNVLDMQYTTRVFSIWCVRGHDNALKCLSHPVLQKRTSSSNSTYLN